MDITEEEYLGGVAYNAYCETTGWKSASTGAILPDFYNVPEAVKNGWIAAARAVIDEGYLVPNDAITFGNFEKGGKPISMVHKQKEHGA